MHNIARALLRASTFIELADEETLDPDSAVRALEDVASSLRGCSSEEVRVLKEAIELELQSMPGEWGEARKFLASFLKAVGLEE